MSGADSAPGVEPTWTTADVDEDDVADRRTIRLDDQDLAAAERLVDAGIYVHESAVVRAGVRRVLSEPSDHAPVGAGCETMGNRRSIRFTPAMDAGLTALVNDDQFPTVSDAVRDGIHRVARDHDITLEDEDGKDAATALEVSD